MTLSAMPAFAQKRDFGGGSSRGPSFSDTGGADDARPPASIRNLFGGSHEERVMARDPQVNRIIEADVFAIEQTIMLNRLGAKVASAEIFALARECEQVGGKWRLKSGFRPRPLVLRAGQRDRLRITFTNHTSQSGLGLRVTGLQWMPDAKNMFLPTPGQPTTYDYYAADEGTFLVLPLVQQASVQTGLIGEGLFGSCNVQPRGAEFYRSQVTREDLHHAALRVSELAARNARLEEETAARNLYLLPNERQAFDALLVTDLESSTMPNNTQRRVRVAVTMDGRIYTRDGHPLVDYQATDAQGVPLLSMLQAKGNDTFELIRRDLTAIITGPDAGRFPESQDGPSFYVNPAMPDRRQPYREFTITYHDFSGITQPFAEFFTTGPTNAPFLLGNDGFQINYGSAAIGPEIVANRLQVGPEGNWDAVGMKFEEFFLSSWAVGDPAQVVDVPASQQYTTRLDGAEQTPTLARFPDDPSNVYHSYMKDHVKFRVHSMSNTARHVHHLHAHQWLHSPNSDNGHYLDSQLLVPGASYTMEIVYSGSGNRNQTVGDSIFHCHFYPHFARGMWSLWRVHDVFEEGTRLDPPAKPGGADRACSAGARALPDGQIVRGTPIPGLVPLPTLGMAPYPAQVHLYQEDEPGALADFAQALDPLLREKNITQIDAKNDEVPATLELAGRVVVVEKERLPDGSLGYRNPGYPFFIPGIAGHRPPHPPLDFATQVVDGKRVTLDGGLPRHQIVGGHTVVERHTRWDFTKEFYEKDENGNEVGGFIAFQLPEEGTAIERAAMRAHAQRSHPTYRPDGAPGNFTLNGLPPIQGAPYADPAVRENGSSQGTVRRYKAAVIQTDVVLNKMGWHYPQQRMISLWDDVDDVFDGSRPPQPFFFRANSDEVIEFWHTNLIPNYYELDDFQVRTPTDVLGQHIHLVKFDVTSSDGAANGFNYEDGTFGPDEVRLRIDAANLWGGLYTFDPETQWGDAFQQVKLKAKTLKESGYPFGDVTPPYGQNWLGTQTTVQRFDTDPLLNDMGVDRTVRTVFTHDHFSPSTHQQVGYYAGLLVEPQGSTWSDSTTGETLGTRADGGPTTWQADILLADGRAFREVALEFQDTQLAYESSSRSPGADGMRSPGPVRAWSDGGATAAQRVVPPSIITALRQSPPQVSEGLVKMLAGLGFVLTKGTTQAHLVRAGIATDGTPEAAQGIAWTLHDSTTELDYQVTTRTTTAKPGILQLPGALFTTPAPAGGTPLLPQLRQDFAANGIVLSSQAELQEINLPPVPAVKMWVVLDYAPGSGKSFETGRFPVRVHGNRLYAYTPDVESWSDSKFAINPPASVAPVGSYTFEAPFPTLISGGGQGTNSMMYRNEPVGYRLYDPTATSASQPWNDPALALASIPGRKYMRARVTESGGKFTIAPAAVLNDQPTPGLSIDAYQNWANAFKFPQPLTPSAQGEDPYTPLLRAYRGDPVQVRTLVGAHFTDHAFTIEGVKWLFEPSLTDSGYRNAQEMGLSEHFELIFDAPWLTQGSQAGFADLVYAGDYDELRKGEWGLMRVFDTQTPGLQELPNNPVGPASDPYRPVRFDQDLRIVALNANGANNAMMLALEADVTITNGIATLKPGVPNEPLVLRFAAGEWVRVTLTNGFDPSNALFTTAQSLGPGNGIAPENAKFFISSKVGFSPQLVGYDAGKSGLIAGFNNQGGLVGPGESATYTFYTGDVGLGGGTSPRELGAINFSPSDPLFQAGNGLFGAGVVEPEGATWTYDAQTRTQATVTAGDGVFRDLVVVFNTNGQNTALINYQSNLVQGGNRIYPNPPVTMNSVAGMETRLRMLSYGSNMAEVWGDAWQEEPWQDHSRVMAFNPESNWVGHQQIYTLGPLNLGFASAGGDFAVPSEEFLPYPIGLFPAGSYGGLAVAAGVQIQRATLDGQSPPTLTVSGLSSVPGATVTLSNGVGTAQVQADGGWTVSQPNATVTPGTSLTATLADGDSGTGTVQQGVVITSAKLSGTTLTVSGTTGYRPGPGGIQLTVNTATVLLLTPAPVPSAHRANGVYTWSGAFTVPAAVTTTNTVTARFDGNVATQQISQ